MWGSPEPGLAASSFSGWEPTLEAVGSGQALLCACLAHRSLGWSPDGVAAVQGQARQLALSWGSLQYRGPQGQGAFPLLPCSSELCFQELWGLSLSPWSVPPPASRPPLPPAEPPPQGSAPRRPAGSGPSGAGAPGAVAGGFLWLCLCILLALGPAGRRPLCYTEHPCLLHHPVRWPRRGPRT